MKRNLQWFAVHVKARSERKTREQLQAKNIEAYLPLRRQIHQWSDRKKQIDEPLIPGCLFIHIDLSSCYDVLVVQGVIRFVLFNHEPAVIPDYLLEGLKILLQRNGNDIEVTNEYIQKNKLVRITDGPLTNVIGEVSTLQDQQRLLIRFRELGCIIHTALGDNRFRDFDPNTEASSKITHNLKH